MIIKLSFPYQTTEYIINCLEDSALLHFVFRFVISLGNFKTLLSSRNFQVFCSNSSISSWKVLSHRCFVLICNNQFCIFRFNCSIPFQRQILTIRILSLVLLEEIFSHLMLPNIKQLLFTLNFLAFNYCI